jgi:hypothetical protein
MNSVPRNRIDLAIWGGLILVTLSLLYRDHTTGTPPAVSFVGLFLGTAMLCFYLQAFVSRDSVRRSFYVMYRVLLAGAATTLLWVLLRQKP